MPINARLRVRSSNCERFAITLGNETHPGSIWLLTVAIGIDFLDGGTPANLQE
jgi:hypothetical protein